MIVIKQLIEFVYHSLMISIHQPQGILRQYIKLIVYSNFDSPHPIDRLIPDGTANLIIELGDEPQYIYDNDSLAPKTKYTKAWISGMQLDFISISASNKGLCVIQFHAAGAYPILHIPAYELNNRVVDAELILGKSILDLRDKISETAGMEKKFEVIEGWLTSRLRNQTVPEEVVKYAVHQTMMSPSHATINELIVKTGYSHKHFIRLFSKYVGITPKQYQRIIRFNHVLESINNGHYVDWASLSLDCGYYDQAHFIKEFRKFSGLNPQEYLAEQGEYLNYIPIYVS